MSRRPRWASNVAVAAVIVAILTPQLWRVQRQSGNGGLVVAALAVLAVGGGLTLLVWRRSVISGERLAASARSKGLLAGSVWYTAAHPVEDRADRGLLAVRRTGVCWLPATLDPTRTREVPLPGMLARVDDKAGQVTLTTADRVQTYTLHTTKGLLVALNTVGIAQG